jgi:hypothetical protein
MNRKIVLFDGNPMVVSPADTQVKTNGVLKDVMLAVRLPASLKVKRDGRLIITAEVMDADDEPVETIELRQDRTAPVIWSWEDVKSIRPRWSRKRCQEGLDDVAKRLVDRSIELGWEVMDDLLRSRE